MAEKRGSRKDTSFDFFTYMEGVERRQHAIRDEEADSNELKARLGKLAAKTNSLLEDKGLIGSEVAIDEDEIDNCRIAVIRRGKVALTPVRLHEDDDELWATYQGLQVTEDKLKGFEVRLARIHLVHRLLVQHMDIQDPLYTKYVEQSAVLPLEDTDVLQLIEEDEE